MKFGIYKVNNFRASGSSLPIYSYLVASEVFSNLDFYRFLNLHFHIKIISSQYFRKVLKLKNLYIPFKFNSFSSLGSYSILGTSFSPVFWFNFFFVLDIFLGKKDSFFFDPSPASSLKSTDFEKFLSSEFSSFVNITPYFFVFNNICITYEEFYKFSKFFHSNFGPFQHFSIFFFKFVYNRFFFFCFL